MAQKPKIGTGEGATIRAMLGRGDSMAAAARAVGVTKAAVSAWCRRERAAGRTVPIVPPKRRPPRPAQPAADPQVPPAGAASPPASVPTVEECRLLGPEDAQRNLSWLAQYADPSIRVQASRALLAWREKEPAAADPDAVPQELLAMWNDPRARPLLEMAVAAERRGAV